MHVFPQDITSLYESPDTVAMVAMRGHLHGDKATDRQFFAAVRMKMRRRMCVSVCICVYQCVYQSVLVPFCDPESPWCPPACEAQNPNAPCEGDHEDGASQAKLDDAGLILIQNYYPVWAVCWGQSDAPHTPCLKWTPEIQRPFHPDYRIEKESLRVIRHKGLASVK